MNESGATTVQTYEAVASLCVFLCVSPFIVEAACVRSRSRGKDKSTGDRPGHYETPAIRPRCVPRASH